MPTPTKTWKKIELEIGKYLGFKRRGADFGDRTGGKNDLISPGMSIEIKHGKQLGIVKIKTAIQQAKAAANPYDLPMAIVHKYGDPIEESIVCMFLSDWREWYGDD